VSNFEHTAIKNEVHAINRDVGHGRVSMSEIDQSRNTLRNRYFGLLPKRRVGCPVSDTVDLDQCDLALSFAVYLSWTGYPQAGEGRQNDH
jgi:hypothetical protein